MGRFLNADALVATGRGFVGNNMFAYCLNNPVYYADPTGTVGWEIIIPLIIGIIPLLTGCTDGGDEDDSSYSGKANCYAYALGLENDPNTGKPFKSKPFPGFFSGSKWSSSILLYSPEGVKSEFDARIAGDAAQLGYNCYPVTDISNHTPADGNWLIAAAYAPGPSNQDFHFWRLDDDGTWSHKPGLGDVKYVDDVGNTIYDPANCARGRYSEFLGYYEIGPN